MKNLRNLMAWITISAVLMMGTVSANAGVIVAGLDRSDCTNEESTVLDYAGIIIAGITGVVVAGRTGVVVAGRDGVVVAGRDGVVVAGRDGVVVAGRCSTESRGGILLAD